jgi:hypothetical protein
MSILSRIRKKLLSANYNREFELKLKAGYKYYFRKEQVPTLIISCLDGRASVAGFADRLRGIVSCYAYAKATGTPFRIEHIDPFNLEEFLTPNSYDWRLKEGEKSYNLRYVRPLFMIQDSPGKKSMRFFRAKKIQLHLYTNANYIDEINRRQNTNYRFDELYKELFRPSLALESILNIHRSRLISESMGYVSVSFRFMQLMGDFTDSWGVVLPDNEKKDLLSRSLSIVRHLYEREKKRIFVTADSQSFLDEAAKMGFVYVAPGKVGHIGYSNETDVYEKMFVDFCLISEADHVYLARSGKMYRSNFAKTAAMSSSKPFDEIIY